MKEEGQEQQQRQNRIHSVILDITAESIYRKVSLIRDNKKWFHKYVSEKLKQDFSKDLELGLMKQSMEQAYKELLLARVKHKQAEYHLGEYYTKEKAKQQAKTEARAKRELRSQIQKQSRK